MVFRPGRVIMVAALCAIAAGCGGSHSSSPSLTPAGGTRQPQLNGGAGVVEVSTLYVSGQGAVYAYGLAASGNAAPISKTTGYYYQAGGPGGVTASIAGIATNSNGDLVVVQNFANVQGNGNSCQLVYIPQRSSENAVNASTGTCANGTGGNTTGTAVGVTFTGASPNATFPPLPTPSPGPTGSPVQLAIVREPMAHTPVANIQVSPTPAPAGGFTDEIDVLMHYQSNGNPAVTGCDGSTSTQYEVDRYRANSGDQSISTLSCNRLQQGLTAQYRAIGGSTNGAYFVDLDPPSASGMVERYDINGLLTNSGSFPGTAGPMAVAAANGIGYRVLASTAAGVTTIYKFKPAGGASMTFVSALGTFTNPVGAVAVDNSGTVYVGVNQPNGVTKIKVYGPTKTQATDPDYILNNPVRRPNPAASPTARITGIAIAQP